MEKNQALNILVQAVNIAQKRGAYDLKEASAIAAAVSVFTIEQPIETENNDEEFDSEDAELSKEI